MKNLLNNPKPVVYAILLFLLGFFSIRSCEASQVELGPSLLKGYGLVYSESLGEFDIGVMLISDQEWDGTQTAGNNGGVFGERLVRFNKFSMGIGAAYWVTTSKVIGSNLTFHLSMHYDLNDKWRVNYRHWSNAGTTNNNRGQDLLTLGWKF